MNKLFKIIYTFYIMKIVNKFNFMFGNFIVIINGNIIYFIGTQLYYKIILFLIQDFLFQMDLTLHLFLMMQFLNHHIFIFMTRLKISYFSKNMISLKIRYLLIVYKLNKM